MPNRLDFAFVAAFAAAWPLYAHFVEWRRHLRRLAAGDPDARIKLFRSTIAQQWLLVAVGVTLFVTQHRSFELLGLRAPDAGWRWLVAGGVPVAYAVLLLLQTPALARSQAARARLRTRLAALEPLVPHRHEEWRWFQPLAVTAGLCEEFLFRGYLVWTLQPWLGLYGAAAVSVVIFGAAHSYQGFQFGRRAFVAGIGMQAFALITRSIVPGMALHALIDLGSGYVCYLAMREDDTAPTPAIATA